MTLLQHERKELRARLEKAAMNGWQIALPEKYQQELYRQTNRVFPATVAGLLEHLDYLERAPAVNEDRQSASAPESVLQAALEPEQPAGEPTQPAETSAPETDSLADSEVDALLNEIREDVAQMESPVSNTSDSEELPAEPAAEPVKAKAPTKKTSKK